MKKTPNRKGLLYKDQTSIFDVSYREIARRQLFAGFMTGIGATIATLLMGFIVSVILVGLIGPRLDFILESTRTTLEEAGILMPSPEQK